ncbi:uncharacterized protein [Prorops nasuta]
MAGPGIPLLLLVLLGSGSSARIGEWNTCSGRLERALDTLHRESNRRNRLEDEDSNLSYQQELQSAPIDISVSHIAVKLPQVSRNTGTPWATVERCIYEPEDNSLKTRVVFNDLVVSGLVSMHARSPKAGSVAAESCRMTLRLRRAGIEFLTSPIARGRGQMRIRTESSFLEPRFASIYAYGCRPTRVDKQIKRQDKWPPYHSPNHKVYAVRPPEDVYESLEPRQLSISNVDDVEIPNESRQSRALYPIRTVGIWRDNVWITKSTLRKKRASNLSNFKTNISTKNKRKVVGKGSIRTNVLYENSFSGNERLGAPRVRSRRVRYLRETENPAFSDNRTISKPRMRRNLEVITPQDFQTALINERLPKVEVTDGKLNVLGNVSLQATSTKKQEVTVTSELPETLNSTNLLDLDSENLQDEEDKTNFKREENSGLVPETRESHLTENLEDFMIGTDEGRSWQSKEHIAREMEDVFLKGASQVLTRYIERQLHPAIKETLMLSMGYTISYG